MTTDWEIHETVTRELHVRRPHQLDQVPTGRILTYDGVRPPGTYGWDVVAIVMPKYVRRKTGKRLYGVTEALEEVECDAVPNWDLANAVLKVVKG